MQCLLSDVRSRSALFAMAPGCSVCAPGAGGTPAPPGRQRTCAPGAGGTLALPGRQRTCAPGAGGTLALPGRHSMHRCLRVGRPRTQGRTVYVTRAGRPRTQAARAFVLLPAGGTPAHPGARRPCSQDGVPPAHPGARRPCSQDGVPPAHLLRARRPRPQEGSHRWLRARRPRPQEGSHRWLRARRPCSQDGISTSGYLRARHPRIRVAQSDITPSRDQGSRSLLPVRAHVRTAIPAHTHTTSSGGGATALRFRFLRR